MTNKAGSNRRRRLLPSSAWEVPEDLEVAYRRVLEAAGQQLRADVCTVFAINPINGEFDSEPYWVGELRSGQLRWRRPRPRGITSQALARELLVVEDLEQQPEWQSNFSRREQVVSFAAVPLRAKVGARAYGVLYANYRSRRTFGEGYREQLVKLGQEAGTLFANSWLLKRYRQVIRVGEEINKDLDTIENLFDKLDRSISSLLDTSHFFELGRFVRQTGTLDLYRRRGGEVAVEPCKPLRGDYRRVIEQGEPLRLSNRRHSPSRKQPSAPLLQSLLAVPLHLRGQPIGLLCAQHSEPNHYDREDEHVLGLMANHVALALNGIALFQELSDLSQAGQVLIEEADSRALLQKVADSICQQTLADVVVLYPYRDREGSFELPPTYAGDLVDVSFPQPLVCDPGDIPYRILELEKPLYLNDALNLETRLGATDRQRVGTFRQRENISSLAVGRLRMGRETVGVLFLNYRARQQFFGAQRRVIEHLALIAGSAISNARRIEAKESRQARELKVLQEIDSQIARQTDLREVLDIILRGANEILKAEEASILLKLPETGRFGIVSALGRQAKQSLYRELPHDEQVGGIGGWVMRNKQAVRVDNVRTDLRFKDVFYGIRKGTLSELDAPLIVEGSAIGVLNFESSEPGAFSEQHQRFVETLAGQVVLAITRAQDFEQLEAKNREQAALIDLSRDLVGQLELKQLLAKVLRHAMHSTRARAGVLFLHDVQRDELRVEVEENPDSSNAGLRLPCSRGIVGLVAREQQTLSIDPSEARYREIYLAYAKGTRAELAVPLKSGKRLWGVLNLESRRPNHFDSAKQHLVEAMADFAVVALQTAERYQEAREGEERLTALQQVSQQIIRQHTDPAEVMKEIVRQARTLTHATQAHLILYEEGRPQRAFDWDPEAELTGTPKVMDFLRDGLGPPKLGIIAHVANARRSYLTACDAQDDPYYLAGDPTIRSELASPLLGEDDQLVGVLNVESIEPFEFDERDQGLLELFAAEAVVAIQNAQGLQVAQRERDRLSSLLRVGQRLGELTGATRDVEAACELVSEELATRLGCLTVVRLYEFATRSLVLVNSSGAGEVELFDRKPETDGLNGWVFQNRKAGYISDLQNRRAADPPANPSDPSIRSIYVTRIEQGASYFGNLGLSHSEPDYFSPADRQLADGQARQLAITLHRLDSARKQRDLEKQQKQSELLGWLGEAAYGLAHRLSGDPGLLRTYVNFAQDALKKSAVTDPTVALNLERILAVAQQTGDLTSRIKNEIANFKVSDPEEIEVGPLLRSFSSAEELPSGVELRLEIEDPSERVYAIPSHLTSILENLVRNAWEAMPSGGTIVLRERRRGPMIEFEIEDAGLGIAPEVLPRIFEILFSMKGSSGFGLWSAKRQAVYNGGDLLGESPPGRGALFTLTLPRAKGRIEAEFGLMVPTNPEQGGSAQ